MFTAEFWVAVAFVIFIGVLIYFGTHKMVLDALDQRAARIKADLDEARRLKEEAQGPARRVRAQEGRGRARSGRHPRRRQGGSRAARRRGQDQVRGIPRAPHQAGRDQDRTGRGAGARRRAQRRRRGRGRRRRAGADRHGQGQARRRPDRQGHRRSEGEAELSFRDCRVLAPTPSIGRALSCAALAPPAIVRRPPSASCVYAASPFTK